MIYDLRKSRRYDDYMPVDVNAVNGTNGSLLAGPFSGRILDISMHGACLLMTQFLINRYHIFYSTKDDNSRLIELVLSLPDTHEEIHILSRPVWNKVFELKDIRAIRLGIDFMSNPTGKQMQEIESALSKGRKYRSTKWTESCSALEGKKRRKKDNIR